MPGRQHPARLEHGWLLLSHVRLPPHLCGQHMATAHCATLPCDLCARRHFCLVCAGQLSSPDSPCRQAEARGSEFDRYAVCACGRDCEAATADGLAPRMPSVLNHECGMQLSAMTRKASMGFGVLPIVHSAACERHCQRASLVHATLWTEPRSSTIARCLKWCR
jgi:hypothetical protein